MTSETIVESRTHDDYHVGWVCALPTEQTAAIAMLDQRHTSLPKPPNDSNTYTLGSVGNHSVVIACLPKGKIGNVSAATVATNMVSTFPNIRFCLMVGIGGGIPPNVRLGDVVVSTPVGAFPGVVQYDLGKAHQGGTFERTGSLNSPPNSLLAALTMVESEHDLTGSRIPDYLKELEQKWPRLAHKYLKSDSLKDQLFKTEYAHISKSVAEGTADGTVIRVNDHEAEESDAEDDCRFCDKSQTAKRKPREMRVHYGLIASGNEVIKDSIFRDKLNRDLGGQALCVEMEAAGLAHNFPCIAIRGICDYADSHKNNAWQAHAAAVAAAFAKELLGQVQASEVEREPTAKEVLSQIHETVSRSDANIREVKRKMDRKEDVEILEWLTPVNYGPQQSDNFSQRQEGTGDWLLNSKEFQDWINTGKTLFCPGVPGAGKTILTSIVINELMTRFGDDDTVGIAFIYGNYRQRDEQKLNHLLESLLKQLVQGQYSMPTSLKVLYDKHNVGKTRPSSEEISTTLQSVVALFTRVHIIVDALDELNAIDGCRNRFLEEVFKVQAQGSAKFFATSRFIPEITEKFGGSQTIKIRAQDEDVRSFLDSKISQSGKLLQTHREMIKSEIAKAVDGMFLLAQLHFQSVSTKKTLKKIKDALNSLPCGPKVYDIAYKKAMERIAGQDQDSKELATQVLSWITCARGVLKTSELQHALAVGENDLELDKENIPQIEDIVSVCSGLVTVDDKSGIIRLVHYTTQDYLDRTRDQWFPIAESEIALTCIRYLSFDVFKGNFCANRGEYEDRLMCNPFYEYAFYNWGHHALMASMDGCRLVLDFLESPVRLSASVQAIMASESKFWVFEDILHMATEVSTAAYFGLSKTVLALLGKGHLADSKGVLRRTPLLHAAKYGHEEIVKLLIARKDVDPNSKDFDLGETPLSLAARHGQAAVMKLLIEDERVLANCTNIWERTPLSLAAGKGQREVVSLLLSRHDIDPNSTASGRTPLSYAAENGNTLIIELLLEKTGILPDCVCSPSQQTPLSYAAKKGHKAVVELLLSRHDVDPNSTCTGGRTPLHFATKMGHTTVVKQILEKKGVLADYADHTGRTPLSLAAENGDETMVTLLLAMDTVDANRTGSHCRSTPLDYAVKGGHEAVVQLLLTKTLVTWGGSLLRSAANKGHKGILTLLVNSSAIPDEQGKFQNARAQASDKTDEHCSPSLLGQVSSEIASLHCAVENGQVALVKSLLQKGADIDGQRWTNYCRNDEVRKYFVEESKTALHLAAGNGHVSMVCLLLRVWGKGKK
ncbi:ankyrin protein [Fusarium globosum]|uniref:Ankyrin protein n=1 Tax=Fusarium globosum TaxID=78864 RepID=A0A8H5UNK8_9HYPO|nr:ankyrin protein [Fusarium globosum]